MAAADIELTPAELAELGGAGIEAQGARYSDANERLIDR